MPKLLSIQSHVVHGYVGNKAATFPLQYTGWDVDALNTVQFSNHPGYGKFKGVKSSVEEVCDIFEGLESINNVSDYDIVLVGYVPNDDSLQDIFAHCRRFIAKNPQIRWVVDPVLGDNGKIYVSEKNISIYKNVLAQNEIFLVTPNQLELQVLTDVEIVDLSSLNLAVHAFFKLYPHVSNLVVTSIDTIEKGVLYSCGAVNDTSALTPTKFYFKYPSISASFCGSGDLFNSLLISSYFKNNHRSKPDKTLETSLNNALSIMEKVLTRTFELEKRKAPDSAGPLKINDLKIIESRDFLLLDIHSFTAHQLD